MSIQLPHELDELQSFLMRNAGMTVVSAEELEACFGNVCIVMKGNAVQIRFVKDRGQWNVELGLMDASDKWYDVSLLHEMLSGTTCDKPMPLNQKVQVLTKNWDAITESFSPARLIETKNTLLKLGEDRARRMFPEWYP